jgi:hypothetical protein
MHFFVPSQDDTEFIKAALRRSGVSDEDKKKRAGSTTSVELVYAFACQRNWSKSSIEL